MVLCQVFIDEFVLEDGLNQLLFGELFVPVYSEIPLLQSLRENEQFNPGGCNNWIESSTCADVMVKEPDAALKIVLSPACRLDQQFAHELATLEIWEVCSGINDVSWPHIFLEVF